MAQHAADRAERREQVEDARDRMAHRFVRAQPDRAGQRVLLETDRQRQGQLAPPRLREPAADQPRPDLVVLDLREGPLQPEQHPVVEVGRVVEPVLIGDQHVEGGGQLQQLVPVQAVAGQPRDLQPEDDAHLAQGHHRDQPLIARPVVALGAGDAQVVIDDQATLLRPAQQARAPGQLVLPMAALGVLLDLQGRRLPDVDHGHPLQVGREHFRGEYLRRYLAHHPPLSPLSAPGGRGDGPGAACTPAAAGPRPAAGLVGVDSASA